MKERKGMRFVKVCTMWRDGSVSRESGDLLSWTFIALAIELGRPV